MNDADRDLILAVADGLLTGREKDEALARIAADPDLRDEFAAQASAKEALGLLGPAHMTPSERDALRNSLTSQLHLDVATPPPAGSGRRPAAWWRVPAVGLVSVTALLLAVVVVPTLLTGNSSQDSSADADAVVAIAEEVATTSAGSESNDEAFAADTPSDELLLLPEIADNDVEEFFAAVPPVVPDANRRDGANVSESADAGALLSSLPVTGVSTAEVEDCLSTLAGSLPPGDHIPSAVSRTGAGIVVHFGVDNGTGLEHSVSIALDSCTIVATAP